MKRRRTGVIAVVAAALAASAAAQAAPAAPRVTTANLDADRALERILVRGERGLGQRAIVEDVCGGKTVTHRLAGRWGSVDALRVRELDGATARPEIFLD